MGGGGVGGVCECYLELFPLFVLIFILLELETYDEDQRFTCLFDCLKMKSFHSKKKCRVLVVTNGENDW